MKTFIYLFGFLTLAISPVTCTLEQQQKAQEAAANNNTTIVPPSTLDATTPTSTEGDPFNPIPPKP